MVSDHLLGVSRRLEEFAADGPAADELLLEEIAARGPVCGISGVVTTSVTDQKITPPILKKLGRILTNFSAPCCARHVSGKIFKILPKIGPS